MMTRSHFLKLVGAGTAAAAGGSALLGCSRSEGEPSELAQNWAWVGSEPDETSWAQLFGQMREAGIDGVLLQEEDPAVLREVASLARQEGLTPHVWMITMMREEHQEEHPGWYAVNRNGVSTAEDPPYVDYYRFLSPCVEEVRTFLTGHVETLAQVEEVDGIHLDYIRFPDVILPRALQPKYDLNQDREYAEFDYGYHPTCRSTFEAQTGTDPTTLEDPPSHEDWVQFRYDQITGVVIRLADAVHRHDKICSAAVFPTPDIARRLVRQDWPSWPLDAVMPMIYHNFYEKEVRWIESATREGVSALAPDVPLYSGLYVPELSPEALAAATEHARTGGARGISLFNASAMTGAHWKQVRRVLHA